uniref:Uncharacterized protein n=1 Tax=Anguilla anguilla TaxID=7936 RepID=A0A0E9VLW0_ANGAN
MINSRALYFILSCRWGLTHTALLVYINVL